MMRNSNTRVGKDSESWKGALGRHGIGKCNDNGHLLLEFCTEHRLALTNTIFQQKDHRKTTWMHPRSKHWHLLDYVLVRQRDQKDVLHTRVMPSAECQTDHRLVRCKLRLQFKPKPRINGGKTKTLNVGSLSREGVKTNLQAELARKLEQSPASDDSSPDIQWENLKAVILETSETVLGHSKKKNKDWFDENNSYIQTLLTEKRTAHQAHLSHPSCPVKKASFRQSNNILQRKLREVQDKWWERLAIETRKHADLGDYRSFYEDLKAVYGPTRRIQSPLRSLDGRDLLTDNASILERWSEHFHCLFNEDRRVQDTAINRIRKLPIKEELDEPPSLEETITAINQLKSRKAAGIDGIPPEIWKHGGPALHKKLHDFLICCWDQGSLPQDLRNAVIITLYKNKGVKSDCSNYRGITLLSIAGKVLARILLNRLIPSIGEGNLPESQCGFRTSRNTTDMVFVLRQLQEKCREQNKGLHITFVDLTKAFDTVSREGLWLILERLGCPSRFMKMVVQLHEHQ